MKSLTSYFFLISAISFGVIANGYFLKVSEGFTKFLPSILGAILILLAYFSLSKVNQVPNIYAIIGIIFILIGVVLVNYFGGISK